MSGAGARQILIAGGGMVGMTVAFELQKKLRRQIARGEVALTLVDPQSYMTYQSFLPEAGAGSVEPRHVVVPLRRVLPRVRVITGQIASIDDAHHRVRVTPHVGEAYDLDYDELVIALGSVSRTLPIPGLADVGIGFKTVQEAIYLRNRVLERLDSAASMEPDDPLRKRALSFLFVGGGYSGVEAMAELEDMARAVAKAYYKIGPEQMHWYLVDASDRILPEVGAQLGAYGAQQLVHRGVVIKLKTTLKSVVDGHVVLSDGTEFDADTVVWTAGVKANPVLAASDLPLDAKGRVVTRVDLRVAGHDGVWAAGDSAAVPDLTGPEGTLTSPSAQHAVRQAKVLAGNVVKSLRGRDLATYKHKYLGSVATLGLHKGVAQVYGVKLRGLPAWFMHRTYHVSKMPTFNRKVRIVLDWTLSLFFRREVVAFGSFASPREAFAESAREQRAPGAASAVARAAGSDAPASDRTEPRVPSSA